MDTGSIDLSMTLQSSSKQGVLTIIMSELMGLDREESLDSGLRDQLKRNHYINTSG